MDGDKKQSAVTQPVEGENTSAAGSVHASATPTQAMGATTMTAAPAKPINVSWTASAPESSNYTQKITSTSAALASGEKPAQEASAAPDAKPTKEQYDRAYKPETWDATPGGRLAIRTFSRGILGAAFFTAGGLWSRRMMFGERLPDYTFAKNHSWETRYDPTKTFGEIVGQKNPLQFIAKTIDTFIGTPIRHTVNFVGGDGMRATHFRPNQYVYKPDGKNDYYGRSLGFESVMITFDFFCASIGDAMGRDIAGWFDPKVKKDWTDDKGHIKFPEALKSLGKSMWRYVSYNGGEDWFVALPYAYFMKAQRAAIDKFSPGFAKDFDASMNGGSFKVRQHGSDPHYNIVGSYNLEGIFDLQTRFTVYNMGTLLYRELYDKAAHMLRGEHMNLYGAPDAPQDPNKSMASKVGDVGKWAVRGMIKGLINMTPAVPFFWISRGMQSKHRALFIDPQNDSIVSFRDASNRPHYLYANDLQRGMDDLTRQTPVFTSSFNQYDNQGRGKHTNYKSMPAEIGNPSVRPDFNAHAMRHNAMENGFSFLGDMSYRFSQVLDTPAKAMDKWSPSVKNPLRNMLGLRTTGGPDNKGEGFGRFTRPFVNASVSYTPYMWMKGETARLWDHGKTDYALERTIDGATSLNWGEFKAGVGEVWNALLHKPFDDAARDKEGERRIEVDTSAADYQSNEQARRYKERMKRGQLVHANPSSDSQPAADAPWYAKVGGSKKDKEPDATFASRHEPKSQSAAGRLPIRDRLITGERPDSETPDKKLSHQEREELRELLEKSHPPTNSIN